MIITGKDTQIILKHAYKFKTIEDTRNVSETFVKRMHAHIMV